jgi:hypothetical protein
MGEKLTRGEISAKGGKCRSDRKLAAIRNNLKKAQTVLARKRTDRAVKEPAPTQ